MIKKDDLERLLIDFNLGTSTAEKDPLLEVAQIKTQEFSDLYFYDRIDIVRGIKGAGKTALYRLFYLLKEHIEKEDNLFLIFGVEASGDPVFKHFKKYFDRFNEIEFQNFWTIYFLSLIRKKINESIKLQEIITNSTDNEILDKLWSKLDVPFEDRTTSLKDVVDSIILKFSRLNKIDSQVGIGTKPDGTVTVSPGVALTFDETNDISRVPIYIGELKNTLYKMLEAQKFRVWIMLDRLDEVFPRRTNQEENGLKGLLKAAYNLSEKALRIKVFLRDDIIDQLASSKEGFTALTHVTDRASSTMLWEKEKILLLIVKRLFSHKRIQEYYGIDMDKIESDLTYMKESFYKVFPAKVDQRSTLDWIWNSLCDGKGVVTPRDVIDLFNYAKAIEYKIFQLNKTDREFLISSHSLKNALFDLSKNKKEKFLVAEFPHMRDKILKLEGKYSIHNARSMEKYFGANWQVIVSDLVSIGLLKHDPKKANYKIPKIWHKGLSIKNGTDKG